MGLKTDSLSLLFFSQLLHPNKPKLISGYSMGFFTIRTGSVLIFLSDRISALWGDNYQSLIQSHSDQNGKTRMKATIEFGYHRVIVPFQATQTVSQLMTQELAHREIPRNPFCSVKGTWLESFKGCWKVQETFIPSMSCAEIGNTWWCSSLWRWSSQGCNWCRRDSSG